MKNYIFYPKYILFNDGTKDVTVAMAVDALDYIISLISLKSPVENAYKKATTVLKSLKMMLNNNTPPKYSKEDIKTTIDVLEEIINEKTYTKREKLYNTTVANICKTIIELYY